MVTRADSSLSRAMAEQILMNAIEERRGQTPPGPVQIAGPLDPGFDLHILEGSYGSATIKGVWDLRTDGSSLELWARRGDSYSRMFDNLTHREDRWFANDEDPTTQFTVLPYEGRNILLVRINMGHYWSVEPLGEYLGAAPALSAAWKARLGKTWVAADLGMVDYYFDTQAVGLQLTEREGRLVYESFATQSSSGRSPLNGLLDRRAVAAPAQLTNSSMVLEPIDDTHAWTPLRYDSRDLTHLQIVTQGKEEWLRVGSGPSLWRPLEGIPVPDGAKPYVASIIPDRAEWVKLPAESDEYILTAPDSVHWALYNDRLQPVFESWGGAWRLGRPAGSTTSNLYLALYAISNQSAMVQRAQGRTFSSTTGAMRLAR